MYISHEDLNRLADANRLLSEITTINLDIVLEDIDNIIGIIIE